MQRNLINLNFDYQSTNHRIKGLELLNLEINNSFIYSDSILNTATYNNSTKDSFCIKIKGIFLFEPEQILLQKIAFKEKSIIAKIDHAKFQIKSNFNIDKYELQNQSSNLDRFLLQLSCRANWEYKNL
jgi:hypothetical protein